MHARIIPLMRGCACVVALALLATPSLSDARDLQRIDSLVDLTDGTVKNAASPRLLPFKQPATPLAKQALMAGYDKGTVFVRAPGAAKILELAVGKRENEWMPLSILQPGVFVFVWRETFPTRSGDGYRDILRSIDLETHRELWRRELGFASAFGDRYLLLDT